MCVMGETSLKEMAVFSTPRTGLKTLASVQDLPPVSQTLEYLLHMVGRSRQHARLFTQGFFLSQGLMSRAPTSVAKIQRLVGGTQPGPGQSQHPCMPVGWLQSDSCLSHSSKHAQCSWQTFSSFICKPPPGQGQAICSASLLLPVTREDLPTNNGRSWLMATSSLSLLSVLLMFHHPFVDTHCKCHTSLFNAQWKDDWMPFWVANTLSHKRTWLELLPQSTHFGKLALTSWESSGALGRPFGSRKK